MYKGGKEMENVIDLTNTDKPFLSEAAGSSESVPSEQNVEQQSVPRERHAEGSRASERIVMTITALCGAAAGVILALGGKADSGAVAALSEHISKGFGEIFFYRLISVAAVLFAEFLLGFFAFGDHISWLLPLFVGIGSGFYTAALQKPVFLPSEIAVLLVVIFAGARSALFSRKLLGLASGDRAYMRGMTAREYTAKFALMLPIIAAAAVYEGIAATTFGA